MDKERQHEVEQQLSQCGALSGQELCLWEEVTAQEFYQWQEAVVQEFSTQQAVKPQEFHQGGDGTQQELYQWEESVLVQEMQEKEDDETYQELSCWEGDVTGQELSLWEAEGYQKDSPLEEDVQGHPHVFQREEDEIDAEVSQEQDKNGHTGTQLEPSSPSSVGTQEMGEAAHDLPSASPAPRSRLDTETTAAAASAATAGEEEATKPLPPAVEKAPASPGMGENIPTAQTDRSVRATYSPIASNQAQLDSAQHLSSETMSQVSLDMQEWAQQTPEQRDLEQSMAAEEDAAAPGGERELVPISAPHSPSCSPSPVSSPLQSLTLSKLLEEEEEAERGSVRSEQEGEEAVLAGELELSQCKDKKVTELLRGDAGSYKDMSQGEACGEQDLSQVETSSNHELSDWDDYNEQELSKGEARSTDKFSDWEECLEQELSLREVVGSPALSEWEAYREQELSQEDLGSYQEPSDWEESIDQQCAREEDFSSLEVPEENGNLPSTQSSFEDYRDRELKQGNWHSTSAHSITVKPLLPEDDDGDGVSLLELHEQASERTQGGFAGEELPVPKPREAWGECQPGPHRKRPSRVRRALRALRRLCCCPCLAPQLED